MRTIAEILQAYLKGEILSADAENEIAEIIESREDAAFELGFERGYDECRHDNDI